MPGLLAAMASVAPAPSAVRPAEGLPVPVTRDPSPPTGSTMTGTSLADLPFPEVPIVNPTRVMTGRDEIRGTRHETRRSHRCLRPPPGPRPVATRPTPSDRPARTGHPRPDQQPARVRRLAGGGLSRIEDSRIGDRPHFTGARGPSGLRSARPARRRGGRATTRPRARASSVPACRRARPGHRRRSRPG